MEPAAGLPRDPDALESTGLYSWWADDEGRPTLGEPFGLILPPLIYAGQTGSTSRLAGVKRGTTLRSRILDNHFNDNVRSSTFRKTINSILLEPLKLRTQGPARLDEASKRRVSTWMRGHLAIATVRVEERSRLAGVEVEVLAGLGPALNLMGMATTPLLVFYTPLAP
jgi:hypothetical protein